MINFRKYRAHHAGARRKFLNEPNITLLNSQHILLLPFTFDSFGSPGFYARRLLISTESTLLPPAPQPPWNIDTLSNSPNAIPHPSSYDAFLSSLHPSLPSAILNQADTWWHAHQPSSHYGDTHHTSTPSQWAIQALALNISTALAHHLSSSASTIANTRRRANLPHTSFDTPYPTIYYINPGPSASEFLFPNTFP